MSEIPAGIGNQEYLPPDDPETPCRMTRNTDGISQNKAGALRGEASQSAGNTTGNLERRNGQAI